MEETREFLAKSVNIDPINLQGEFTEISATLAYWNALYADVLRAQLHSKIARERLFADLLFRKRTELDTAAMGSKTRVTEAMVNAAIETDPAYCEARDKEANALAESARIKGIVEAVKTKKEMLISLGAHVRAEMDSDPSIKALHRNAHLNTEELERE